MIWPMIFSADTVFEQSCPLCWGFYFILIILKIFNQSLSYHAPHCPVLKYFSLGPMNLNWWSHIHRRTGLGKGVSECCKYFKWNWKYSIFVLLWVSERVCVLLEKAVGISVCVCGCVPTSACCTCSHAQLVCTSLTSTCLFSNVVSFGIRESKVNCTDPVCCCWSGELGCHSLGFLVMFVFKNMNHHGEMFLLSWSSCHLGCNTLWVQNNSYSLVDYSW